MSDPLKIEVKATLNKWDSLEDAILAKLALVVSKTAEDVEANAKLLCPVDTGHLKGSIQAVPVDDLNWEVNVGAEYGIYVEFGTENKDGGQRMPAKPYLIPACDLVRPAFSEAVKQALGELG